MGSSPTATAGVSTVGDAAVSQVRRSPLSQSGYAEPASPWPKLPLPDGLEEPVVADMGLLVSRGG